MKGSDEGLRIAKSLVLGGMSKYRIAKEISVSWLTVSRWIDGKSKPGYRATLALQQIEKENANLHIS